MVGFAVVGLGKGYDRASEIQQTDGADLRAAVDIREDQAKEVGEELGVDWAPSMDEVLGRDDVEKLAARMADVPNDLHHIAEDVVRAVNEGTSLRADATEGRRTVAVLEAIYKSGREGRPVQMNEVA